MSIVLRCAAIFLDVCVGACIAGYLSAISIDDECKYCNYWADTYTDKEGKIHTICEHCCFNPHNKKDCQK